MPRTTSHARAARQRLGLSQGQVAERLKVSRQSVQDFEQAEAERRITLKSLDRLAAALGCRVDYSLVPLATVSEREPPAYAPTLSPAARLKRALTRLGVSKQRLAGVLARAGVRRAQLFGSITREDFTDKSDVDLLVEFDPARGVDLATRSELEKVLSELAGGRAVQVLSPRIMENPFRRRSIEPDLVTLYDNEP